MNRVWKENTIKEDYSKESNGSLELLREIKVLIKRCSFLSNLEILKHFVGWLKNLLQKIAKWIYLIVGRGIIPYKALDISILLLTIVKILLNLQREDIKKERKVKKIKTRKIRKIRKKLKEIMKFIKET